MVSAVRTGCALGHRATTIRACAHLMKTAARFQLRAQGRSFVPGPNKYGGITGRSPGERPHYGIAGKSPACRGKSRQTGPDVNAGFHTNSPIVSRTLLYHNNLTCWSGVKAFDLWLLIHNQK